MLTALGAETDRVAGLEIGADDYVTKPFSPRELALRVDSVLRRTDSCRRRRPCSPTVTCVLDSTRHEARRDGAPLALTGREFDLLRFLVAHPGVAVLARRPPPAGVGLVGRRLLDGHRARAPAAREDRARPETTGPAGDGVGRRLPLGGVPHDASSAPTRSRSSSSPSRGPAVPASLGLGLAYLLRRRSVPVLSATVALVAVGAVTAGIVGTARAMFLSAHDFGVTLLVAAVAGVVARAGRHPGRPGACRAGRGSWPTRPGGSGPAGSSWRPGPRPVPPSSASSPPSSSAPATGWRSPASASGGWRRPGASWSPGSRTTCARRSPGLRAMTEALEDGIAPDPDALPPADPRRGRPDDPDGRRPLRAVPHPLRHPRAEPAVACRSATWSARRSPGPTRSPASAAYVSAGGWRTASRCTPTPRVSHGCCPTWS